MKFFSMMAVIFLLLSGCSQSAPAAVESYTLEQVQGLLTEKGLPIQKISEPTYFPIEGIEPACYSMDGGITQRVCVYVFATEKAEQEGIAAFQEKLKEMNLPNMVQPNVFSVKNVSIMYIAKDSGKHLDEVKAAVDSIGK